MSGSEGGVYFLSRSELLAWVNNLLQLNYTKVEECCSGAAHCQIMDAVYPGKVPMSKVNFGSRLEYEHEKNFKVLQTVFDKMKVDKPIDINKLIKGKYQDNLEFLQWMKGFFDRNYSGQEYDPVARRSGAKGVPRRPASATAAKDGASGPSGAGGSTGSARVPLSKRGTNASSKAKSSGYGKSGMQSAALEAALAKVKELEEENMELKLSVDGLERERDFYFGKLRDIEIMCQQPDETQAKEDFVQQVTKILYATEDDFVCPDELEKENEAAGEGPAVEVGAVGVEEY